MKTFCQPDLCPTAPNHSGADGETFSSPVLGELAVKIAMVKIVFVVRRIHSIHSKQRSDVPQTGFIFFHYFTMVEDIQRVINSKSLTCVMTITHLLQIIRFSEGMVYMEDRS